MCGRRAREVMDAQEFGLDEFAAGIMLLTHPERLMHYHDLYIDCPGGRGEGAGAGTGPVNNG